MKGLSLCFIYLLVTVYSVHSASYYYRAGREVIVPSVDENVDVAQKQHSGLRLESLEIVPDDKKIATVADTVKSAAIEAVQSQNEEALVSDVKPVVAVESVKAAPVEPLVPVAPVVPIVPEIIPEVKSNVVIDEVKVIEPIPIVESELKSIPEVPAIAAVPIEPVVVVKEEPVVDVKAEEPVVKNVVQDIVKSSPVVNDIVPEVRQQNPIEQFQHQVQSTFQNLLTNIPVINQLVNRPPNQQQSDSGESSAAPAAEGTSNIAQDTPAAAPSLEATQTQVASTPAPNIIQNAINSITSFLQRSTTTVAPATEAPAAANSGTRGGDETVEVVQNIDVDDKLEIKKV